MVSEISEIEKRLIFLQCVSELTKTHTPESQKERILRWKEKEGMRNFERFWEKWGCVVLLWV